MKKTIFDSTPGGKIPRNKFDLSHDKKLSFSQGELVPIMCMEAVPGDSFRGSHELMIRLAALISPAYTRIKAKCETFFVPTRILWDEFEPWVTGGPDGNDATVAPYFDITDLTTCGSGLTEVGSLWDYMGLPCAVNSESSAQFPYISDLPFRAYQQIYNDWYRVPEIQPEIDFLKTSGSQDSTQISKLLPMRNRNWSRDYFTSLRESSQRGSAAAAPIDVIYDSESKVIPNNGSHYTDAGSLTSHYVAGNAVLSGNASTGGAGIAGRIENIASASMLIEKFRIANAVQLFLEAMQRGGSRYTEVIWQMFKRKSQDSRLQRAEFIAGSTGNVMISEVVSSVQFEGTDDLPQGNLAGHGIHVGKGNNWHYTAPEHGYFLTIMSVVPEGGHYGNGLCSGIHKMWTRFNKYDLYWPIFANLGEQAVLTMELTYNPDVAQPHQNEHVLGYIDRYAEYKWMASTVHGDFRTSLDFWHQNRGWIPTTDPIDNPTIDLIIRMDADPDALNRIFAVPTGDVLWALVVNNISAVRPMPYNVIPGI